MNRWDYERAVKASDLPPLTRLILFVLVQATDAESCQIPERYMPSIRKIMRETGIATSDTVIKYRDAAVALGWLRYKQGHGRRNRNFYELTIPSGVPLPPAITDRDLKWPATPAFSVDNSREIAGDAGYLDPEIAGDAGPFRTEMAGDAGPFRTEKAGVAGTSRSIYPDRSIQTPRPGVSPTATYGELPHGLIEKVIEEIFHTTGQTIGPQWAARTARHILTLAGGAVPNPVSYVLAAIRREPSPRMRFLSQYDDDDRY